VACALVRLVGLNRLAQRVLLARELGHASVIVATSGRDISASIS